MSREATERYCAQCCQHATCGYVKMHRTDLCVPLGYYDEGYTQAEEDFAIKCEKKSPITGGEMQLMQEKSSVKFRGEEVSFVKKFYHCVDSGRDFTDTELDNDNMWAIFRAYCEKKGMKSFKDIILRDDTQEG